MTTGKIVQLIRSGGYGYIQSDNGDGDIYFHHSGLDNIDFDALRIGTYVSFVVSFVLEREPNPQAVCVREYDGDGEMNEGTE